MANTDPIEWRLYSSNLTTQLCVLPFKTSHIYFQNNDPGSAEIRIPLDSLAAPQVAIGQLCVMYYRGSQRASFFIDNLKYVDADANEGSGRELSMSGRGALELLSNSIIYGDGTTATSRTFTSVTKASILKTLIDEAQARGELATLAYSFTASVDTNSVAWTDSENYTLPVGTTLLDLARQFSQTGSFDFTLTFSGGIFTLNAYKNGRGSDKSATMYFRVGSNCEEVGRDERGDEIYNVYLVKYQGGYITVSDSTSITTYGRRVKYLNLEQAQTSASATTYASAQLALTKNPKANKTIQVYDGVNPRLFVDYDLGDTVTLDRFGTQTTDKILGIQADFEEGGAGFANIIIDFNIIQYNNQMKISSQLNDLLNQWNTAKDAQQQEVRQWLSIGQPNGKVDALYLVNNLLYIGGNFTQIGTIAANHVATYNIDTGVISATDATGIPAEVLGFTNRLGDMFCFTSTHVYYFYGGVWTSVGTAAGGVINAMSNAGTIIFVGGTLTSIDGVSGSTVYKLIIATGASSGTWSAVGTIAYTCYGLASIGTYPSQTLYGTFSTPSDTNVLQLLYPGTIAAQLTGLSKQVYGLGTVGGNSAGIEALDGYIYFFSVSNHLYRWDGVAGSATDLGAVTPNTSGNIPYTLNLSDVYVGNVTPSGLSAQPIKYSGGVFSQLASAGGSHVYGLVCANFDGQYPNKQDVFAGGDFTTIDGQSINYLAVYVTTFQSLANHLQFDGGNFDMGAAIHAATAAAITDSGEIPFWDSVTSALRKITWANIKTTLKTYFDAIYSPISVAANSNNFINNGGFTLLRRQAHTAASTLTSYANDVYNFDRWYALTQTASIQFAQTSGNNNRYACQMKQNQASAQRFGMAQILPAEVSIGLRNQTLIFQLQAKSSATPPLRLAILEWTGTADAVTSDVVNSWTNGTFTTGNFFKSTSMAVTAVSSSVSASGSFADFSVSGTLSTSCNNIIVMVWSENTAAQNVTVDVTRAGLYAQSTLQTWQEKSLREELANAMFYFRAWAEVSQIGRLPFGSASSATNCIVGITGPMRTTPTATYTGTVQLFETQTSGVTAITAVSAAATDETFSSFNLAFTTAAGLTAGRSYFPILNAANSYVWLDAEL